MGRLLQLSLYKQRSKEYSRFNLRKGKLLRWLESFISEAASDEVDHGIIENHAMKMPHWQESLSIFGFTDVRVRTLRHLRSRVASRMRPANLLNHLLGGVIYGTCQKQPRRTPVADRPDKIALAEWLACPSCRAKSSDVRLDNQQALNREGDRFVCVENGCSYPIIEDIPILIPAPLRKELYPKFG